MFLYEMHMHTKETSACGQTPAAEMVRSYKERGFTGVFVTDHFFNGNTTVDRNLPWADMVEAFCEGYYNAREEGQKLDLDVFFGWEYSCLGTDFLTYGLDENWLLKHPEVMDMSVPEYCAFVKKEGGMVIHAHPYREDSYIEMIRLIPRSVEGVETYNAGRNDLVNEMADAYADKYRLLKIAGSDNHTGAQGKLGAMALPQRINNDKEMIEMIRNGRAKMICL